MNTSGFELKSRGPSKAPHQVSLWRFQLSGVGCMDVSGWSSSPPSKDKARGGLTLHSALALLPSGIPHTCHPLTHGDGSLVLQGILGDSKETHYTHPFFITVYCYDCFTAITNLFLIYKLNFNIGVYEEKNKLYRASLGSWVRGDRLFLT